jgi:2-polyprenyl-3-methyl-5-hydroxy-6-metoxy-1,4-benzoquinol methylase
VPPGRTGGYDDYYSRRGVDPGAQGETQLAPYLRALLPADRGAPILDIGCGPGGTLQALQRAGYASVMGIDLSAEAVAACERKGLSVRRCDLLDFAATHAGPPFALIVMSHVLEHLPKERIIGAVAAIRNRLLAPGGSLFVAVPNAQSTTGCYWAYEDFTHTTLFTAGSLLYVLQAAGFSTVEFLDPDGTASLNPVRRAVMKALLKVYGMKIDFWNRVTSSSFHRPSPRIFTYEIKARATNREGDAR